MIRAGALALAALTMAQAAEPQAARLRGLDKFSGLTQDFTAAVEQDATYGRLRVRVRACRDAGAGATAYLEIADALSGAALFSGWMFASDPAVSALDHPRYDVWVIACSTASGEAS